MVLPNPASPATTMPETSASRTMTGAAVLGPPQPPGRQGGRRHAGQVDPGRRQQRVAVQAAQPDQPRTLLLGPDADTAPGVGQIAGGPLVVGQAGASDGRDGGGHALVVSDELGRWEAVLAGPLIPVAKAEGLGEQRPLSGQPPRLPGPLPDGGLLGMPAGLASPQPPGQAGSRPGWRCRRPGPAACDRPTRVASITHRLPSGSRGVGGGGRSAARHSSARPAPRRRHRPGRAGSSGCASRWRRPGSRARRARPGYRAWGSRIGRIMGSTPDARARC